MGFEITLERVQPGGQTLSNVVETTEFSVQEASTPLAAGDSSGQVGAITFTIPKPDPVVEPNNVINLYGAEYLIDFQVRVSDSKRGFTLGTITSVSRADTEATINISALSLLGKLNVYNLQTEPFVGTLRGAFEYYCSLASSSLGVLVDPSIENTIVTLPGWNGELWYNLKQLAAAIQCDISLIAGVVVLRPIRNKATAIGRDMERSVNAGSETLAQYIEVYQYNNRAITNELVYPPGGWNDEVTVINVNSGETIEEVLELSASVSSIQQPVMTKIVSPDYRASSVFTAVGDDGIVIDPAEWAANGGKLTVAINPDTISLTVTITAPTGLVNKNGEFISMFSISLNDDVQSVRYSTLRIVGAGVAFDKQLVRVATGIGPEQTGTEVGVTIDNPYLSTADQVYNVATWAVGDYDGSGLQLSGTLSEPLPNPNGDPSVQTFGNVAGARVWDVASRRWYRIREATINPDIVQFQADDDLMWDDFETYWNGKTWGDFETAFVDFTWRKFDFMGLRQNG